ncbi:MAG: glucose-1-phosphate adenylyltransferase [Methylibium sp. NZG]|nr:MAG: glucose-1-phosphate adenylyltransferase [Methylibium sp. NZG]
MAHRHTCADLSRRTHALVLAQGRGNGLMHLTEGRAKPAVPFAGGLRIIDFALSNCINSGIRRVSVLTQHKAQSLVSHVESGWGSLDSPLDELIDVLPAHPLTCHTGRTGHRAGDNGYRGTADAVFQNIDLLREADPQYVLVLAGDHVYTMDYRVMLAEHASSGADVTIACTPVPIEQAGAFGVLETDAHDRVTALHQSPPRPPTVPAPAPARRPLANMGICVFNASVLYDALARDAADPMSSHDVGHDLLPRMLARAHVQAHRYERSCVQTLGGTPCWRDVGTVDAYWEAQMDLIEVQPQLNLYDDDWPVRSLPRQLAPAKFVLDATGRRGMAIDSVVSSGCIVSGATVRRSLLSFEVRVEEGSRVEDCVVLPNVRIGRGVVLRRCIVDEGCQLPDGFAAGMNAAHDAARFHVTERGVTLITPAMLGQGRQRHSCGDAMALQ